MEVIQSPMQVTLAHSNNPFIPMAGRKLGFTELHYGMTVTQVLKQLNAHPGRARARLTIDGEVIPRAKWSKTKLTKQCYLQLQQEAEGGGKGGSNPLEMVLTIALMIAAPEIGGFLATQMGVAGATVFGVSAGTILGGVVSIAGKFIIGALIPPPSAQIAQSSPNLALPNQTYSLNGGQNSARPYQPLILVFGTHRIYPDISANAHIWYKDNDQYMSVIFNYGLTDITLSDHKIGDTDMAIFSDVIVEDVAQGNSITTFSGNLQTLDLSVNLTPIDAGWSGSTWTNNLLGNWTTRTTSADTSKIQLDLIAQTYIVQGTGDYGWDTVKADIEYKNVISGDWTAVDIYSQFSNDKPDTTRTSLEITFPQVGQYDVRVRANFAQFDPTYANIKSRNRSLSWAYMHSFQSEVENYAGQKRICVTLKASGQLNGTINRFSSLAIASCNYWNGTAWVYGPTRNPAAWYLHFAKGKVDQFYGIMYGANLTDSQIDLAALEAWAEYCDTNNLTIDAIIDSPQNCSEVFTKIARCGRATYTWATGKLGVVFDEANAPVVGMFGMFNIRKNTFNVSYISENLADEVLVNFVNKDLNYTMDDGIRVPVPGTVGQPKNPVTLDLFGVTNKVIALQEARLLAASQYYHRRRISWEADIEGLLVKRGDVVQLSHDLTQWGNSGRIIGWNAGTKTLTLDQDIDRTGTNWINLRWPNGYFEILPVVAGAGIGNTIVLVNALPTLGSDGTVLPDIGIGNPIHDWAYQYSPLATPGKRVKITSLRPLSHTHVQVEAVDDEPAYYTYTGGAYIPPTTQITLDYTPQNLTVTQQLISLNFNTSQSKLTLNWSAISGAEYVIRTRTKRLFGSELVIVSNWSDIGSTSSTSFEIVATEGDVVNFEVSPLIKVNGLWGKATASITVVGRATLPADVTNFQYMIVAPNIQLAWSLVNDIDILKYEVREGSISDTWETALNPKFATGSRMTIEVNLGIKRYFIKALDTVGNYSANAAFVDVDISLPADVGVFTVEDALNGTRRFRMQFTGETPVRFSGFKLKYITGRARDWAAGILLSDSLITTSLFETQAIRAGTWTIMAKAVDIFGQESAEAAYIMIDLGDTLAQNLIDVYDFKANTWPGVIYDGTVDGISGDLLANDTTSLMWTVDSTLQWTNGLSNMWTAGSDAMFSADAIQMFPAGNENLLMFTGTYPAMQYETSWFAQDYGLLWMTSDGDASYQVEIRDPYPDAMWPLDANPMWNSPTALMWRYNANYVPFTTRFKARRQKYDIRTRFGASTTRGRLRALKANIDAEDIIEKFNDLPVIAGGTRLPITQAYRKIVNVKLTLQDDGGSAVTLRTKDKNNVLGPLIECLSSSTASVNGLVDAEIQGY